MAVTTVELLSVPVSDQDRAKRFYTEILGFAELSDTPLGPDMRWVMLAPPGGGTRIALVTWFDSMPAGSLSGTVLACDDLEATIAELEARGLTFAEDDVQAAPWGRWKTFSDPDGNGWVLQQSTQMDGESARGPRPEARGLSPASCA
jgi:catechol 2,3-dioxygenase-like lactoylglutathione lyase family enzyme